MNYEQLKSSVQQVIKENGNEEITGNLLQQTLLAIISALGLGYQFMGEGTPETTPGTPDARVAYLCVQTGTYSNFGTPFTLDGTKIALCLYDTNWGSSLLPIPTSLALDAYLKIANLATSTGDSEVTSMTQKAIKEALAEKEDTSNKVTEFSNPTDTQYPSAKLVSDSLDAMEVYVNSLLTRAGIAEGIADTISAGVAQEFLQRQSGGDGVNCIKRIKGKTIAWNQLVEISDLHAGSIRDVTITANANGSVTLSGTASGDIYYGITSSAKTLIKGHQYLVAIRRGANSAINHFWVGAMPTSPGITGQAGIYTPTGDAESANIGINIASGEVVNETVWVQLVDLTLLGLGDLTAAQFEALYPALYYAPASVLKSNDAAALLTVGRNQWDEQWELGTINTQGQPDTNSNQIRSKNFIPAFGGSTYYIKGSMQIHQYRADKSYIDNRTFVTNSTITLAAECRYIKFRTGDGVTSYNPLVNPICINLSDASFNGTYEPYWKRVLALRLSELTGIPEGGTEADRVTMFPNGLGGAGSAFDSLFVENGVTKARGTMALKIDLGGLSSWSYGEYGGVNYFQCPVSGLKAAAPTSVANLICTRYTPRAAATSTGSGNGIATLDSGGTTYIRIFDSSMSSADVVDGVIAKLSGVELLAEAATPIVYTDLQYADGTPFTMPATILVDNYGTERIQAPEGATTPSAPFCCDSNYSIGIANLVKKLAEL